MYNATARLPETYSIFGTGCGQEVIYFFVYILENKNNIKPLFLSISHNPTLNENVVVVKAVPDLYTWAATWQN